VDFTPRLREIKLQDLWNEEKLPTFAELLDEIDDALMAEIRSWPVLSEWYKFFDSLNNPLNPREFLHFWSSLTEEEQIIYKLVTPSEMLKGIQ